MMTKMQFLQPGETITTVNMSGGRRGCAGCLLFLLLLGLPLAFVGGSVIPPMIASAQKPPTSTPTQTATNTPTGTLAPTSTPTRTPIVLLPAPRTPTPTRDLTSGNMPQNLPRTATPTITPTSTPTPCLAYYRVKPGDNLSSIASRYRVRTGLIAQINKISNPDRLFVGVILKIPFCFPPTKSPTLTPTLTPTPTHISRLDREN